MFSRVVLLAFSGIFEYTNKIILNWWYLSNAVMLINQAKFTQWAFAEYPQNCAST